MLHGGRWSAGRLHGATWSAVGLLQAAAVIVASVEGGQERWGRSYAHRGEQAQLRVGASHRN
jgi:hypothetical protein